MKEKEKRASTLRKGALVRFWVVIAAIVAVFCGTIGTLAGSIRQGLDLQGGTHIVMQAEETKENPVTPEAMNQVVGIMQKRINEMGLTEPIIQREGTSRIIIELPGEKILRRRLRPSARRQFWNLKMKKAIRRSPGKICATRKSRWIRERIRW